MFRYVAFAWNDEDPAARIAARAMLARPLSGPSSWQCVLRGRGLEVRCADVRPASAEAYRLAGGRGVVLGKLFERGGGASRSAPLEVGESESSAMLESGGTCLIERYWGCYVVFLHDAARRTSWVLRDPSAGLPCYTMRCGPVEVFFSWLEDVLPLAPKPLTVDWSYLLACLSLLRQHCERTALREVSQLLGGQSARLAAGEVTRSFGWDPLAIATSDTIEDGREAVESLAACVRDVVHAWGACYSGILLSLSGGLDSSILLACLADAPQRPRIDCHHYYPLAVDLDERRFARLAAERAGVTLIERPRVPGYDLQGLLRIHATPEPTNYPYYLEHSRAEAGLAAERGAQAVWIGYGGDQLFYQERAHFVPGDFLCRRGLRPELWRVLLDAARMDEVSVWRVLGETLRDRALGRRWALVHEAGRSRPLLSRLALADAARVQHCVHPLLRCGRDAPSGKLWHAHQIIAPFECYDPLGEPDDPPRLAPLAAQPLMELCLRIPTYVLVAGGWDRALARRAFYKVLPPPIRNRRHKGGMDGHARLTIERNRPFLRDLLQDGWLVREGVIDPHGLERALQGRADSETQSGELLDYAGVEAWLRRWREQDAARASPVWQTGR